jgi:hypothetical protein
LRLCLHAGGGDIRYVFPDRFRELRENDKKDSGVFSRRGGIPMAVVEDNMENMETCKRFCGTCPTYHANRMKESPPHALFCARGKSAVADKAENKGCNCFQCDVFKKKIRIEGRLLLSARDARTEIIFKRILRRETSRYPSSAAGQA